MENRTPTTLAGALCVVRCGSCCYGLFGKSHVFCPTMAVGPDVSRPGVTSPLSIPDIAYHCDPMLDIA
eukprot:518745-Rhodomonas_salina.9